MEIGDVVHLKSGGEAMTVSENTNAVIATMPGVPVEHPFPIVCMWHDNAGVPRVERYAVAMLVVKETKAAPAKK